MKRASIVTLVLLMAACTGGDRAADVSGADRPDADVIAAVDLPPLATCPDGSNPDTPGPANQARPGKHGGPMAFDRQSGSIVLVETNLDVSSPAVHTWTFDVCTDTWSQMDPTLEAPADVRKLMYDEDSDVTVALGGSASGRAYDVETNVWVEGGAPQSVDGFQAFYDPVTHGRWVAAYTVMGFEPFVGGWIELVPPL